MGMFDTMQQGMAKSAGAMGGGGGGNSIQSAMGAMGQAQPMGKLPNAMGQGFAQQKPMNPAMSQGVGNVANAWQQKKMQKPNNQMANMAQNVGNVASNWAQNKAGAGGSNSMIQAKQQMQEAQQAQQGGGLGPSIPAYQQLQQTLAAQKGGLKTPYDTQQESLAQQVQQQPQGNPMQSAQEQMRGYDGPDLGSQDPRELARMGNQNQLYGSAPQSGLQAPPFQGGGNPSFQDMFQGAEIARPDVMPRGLGPSYGEQMDENGLEPRRGAR